MTTISRVNGIRLAAWVYANHPKLFRQLLAKAKAANAAASKTKNLKGFGCACAPALAGFGATDPLSSFTPTLTPTADLTGSLSSDLSSAIGSSASGSSGGFWSGLGSDLSSLGSDVMSGISSAGSYLTSGTGLSNLTSLANTYFASKSNIATANAQQAVLNAQVQRTASGYSPAPVTYTTNAAGQVIPVMQSATGYSPLTSAGIASMSGFGMPSWLPWAAAGALGIFVLVKVL